MPANGRLSLVCWSNAVDGGTPSSKQNCWTRYSVLSVRNRSSPFMPAISRGPTVASRSSAHAAGRIVGKHSTGSAPLMLRHSSRQTMRRATSRAKRRPHRRPRSTRSARASTRKRKAQIHLRLADSPLGWALTSTARQDQIWPNPVYKRGVIHREKFEYLAAMGGGKSASRCVACHRDGLGLGFRHSVCRRQTGPVRARAHARLLHRVRGLRAHCKARAALRPLSARRVVTLAASGWRNAQPFSWTSFPSRATAARSSSGPARRRRRPSRAHAVHAVHAGCLVICRMRCGMREMFSKLVFRF